VNYQPPILAERFCQLADVELPLCPEELDELESDRMRKRVSIVHEIFFRVFLWSWHEEVYRLEGYNS
jgi:hypothetical protein